MHVERITTCRSTYTSRNLGAGWLEDILCRGLPFHDRTLGKIKCKRCLFDLDIFPTSTEVDLNLLIICHLKGLFSCASCLCFFIGIKWFHDRINFLKIVFMCEA